MSDLNILFRPEDLLAHKKKPSQLPLQGGPKVFAPDADADDEVLSSLLQEHGDVLQEQRVSKKSNLSVGSWVPGDKVVEVSVAKGPHWQHFGHQNHGKMLLQPHEALFLLEQVYAYFLRLGFIVLKHQSRRNHESDTQTDMANPERNEKQQETATSFECERSIGADNGKGGKPLVMSPVTHLWTSEDDCRPLLRPEDATSTAAVLSKLQVIKNQRMTEANDLSAKQQSLQVAFDVYQPGLNFKKSDPGTPAFCVTVCRFSDSPPSLAVMSAMRKECACVPLKIALVDGGSVSFYSVLDVDSPTFITKG
ncbi:tRNA-splicing endonuclease subunit Sen54 [Stylophora pistillata]|uniref:tRNA-splicing endonuclease subunit Sen54 n=1 Tax=Stylophora pistillata TaxID=50429 RepID=A0A2B4RSX9_STYPI|nr:tRNA-splicing endonuclease subunit Sen54 [Stylophora pistillata]